MGRAWSARAASPRRAADLRGRRSRSHHQLSHTERADLPLPSVPTKELRLPLLPNSARYILAYLFAGLYAASSGIDCQLSRAVRIEGRADRRLGASSRMA